MKRVTSLLCAAAVLGVAQLATAAISFPTVNAGAVTYDTSAAAQPGGSAYGTLHLVSDGTYNSGQLNQVMWMPSAGAGTRQFQLTPDSSGNVTLNLSEKVNWQSYPSDQWNDTVSDGSWTIRRYFLLGYSTDGGQTINWQNGGTSAKYTGAPGNMSGMPVGTWTKVSQQFTFTVDPSATWYYSEDRTLDIARWSNAAVLTPVDVSFDDITVSANGTNLMTKGNFEYDQAAMNANWTSWLSGTGTTMTITAVPEPATLGLLLLPVLALIRRRQA